MFLPFFLLLRQRALPVTLPEYLTLLDALRSEVGSLTVEDFYYLSKTALVKHEQHLDLFDRLFGDWVAGTLASAESALPDVPPDWLRNGLMRHLTDAEKAALQAAGGLDSLHRELAKLLNEEQPAREGGVAWTGVGNPNAGTDSPADAAGNAPEGRPLDSIANGTGNRKATKVWEERDYKNLDDSLELNTRNMKMAMRHLRVLTREGAANELDLDGTIAETSRNGGYLDIKLHPSRQNRVKVLILFDVGGSMDEHVDLCNQLFSAARYQFKHLEFLYFHNCIYETLWRNNRGDGPTRRDRVPTYEVLHTYNKAYKVIFVGDAAMSPYEITQPHGSVEHYNEEAGIVWLDRFRAQYPHLVWLNPTPAGYWQYTHSTNLIREWLGNRMFPLTLNGLGQAMKSLKNPKLTFDPR